MLCVGYAHAVDVVMEVKHVLSMKCELYMR